jgi:hypothetical protein
VASAEDLQDASDLPILPLVRTTWKPKLARFVVRKVQAAWLAYFFYMAPGLPSNSQVVPSEAFENGKEHAQSHLSSGHVATYHSRDIKIAGGGGSRYEASDIALLISKSDTLWGV